MRVGLPFSLVANSHVNNDATGLLFYQVNLSKHGFTAKTIDVSYFFATKLQVAQRKWNALTFTSAHIKPIDGITVNPNILPSAAGDPTFPSNPYTLQGESGITVRYVANSRVNNDGTGSYSYRVTLDKTNRTRKTVQVTYNRSFFSQAKWNALTFTAAHIKAIDGIKVDDDVFPSTIGDPTFPRNPYTLNSEKDITVGYVANSRVNSNGAGSYSYKALLSKTGFTKEVQVDYLKSFLSYSRKTWTAKTLTGHTDWVPEVAFSPDGTKIASASVDRTIKIWKVSDGTLIRTLTGDRSVSVAFSPDGTKIASGSADRTIKIWKVSDGTLIRTLTASNGYIRSLAFSPDGTKIVAGSKNTEIWKVSDGSLLKTLTGDRFNNTSVAFSPDGTKFVSNFGRRGTIKVMESF